MADYPPDFSRTANDAVSRLHDYQAQNPLRVTTGPRGYSTSPSPGLASPSMSPTTSVRQLSPPSPKVPSFQPSRMAIPPTAYAPSHTTAQHAPPKAPPPIIGTQSKSPSPPYAPPTGRIPIMGTQSKSPSPPYAPPTGHMPVIGTQSKSPSPEPSPGPYVPQIYREPLDRLTREMLYDRIYLVLRDILAIWWAENPDAMHRLVYYLSDYVINLGVHGIFGPNGIQSLWQLCMFIGHEGRRSYMCLAVHPERGRTGAPTIVLKGDLCEKEGNDPLVDEEVYGLAKDGFEKAALELHAMILAKSPKI